MKAASLVMQGVRAGLVLWSMAGFSRLLQAEGEAKHGKPAWIKQAVITTYRKDDPGTKWQTLPGKEGKELLKVQSSGGGIHDGISITLDSIKPDTAYRIRAKVRGKGRLILTAFSSHGWTYPADREFTLSDAWKDLNLQKVTGAGDRSMKLCFITPPGKVEAVDFELGELSVEAAPIPLAAPPRKIVVKYPLDPFLSSEKAAKKNGVFCYEGVPVPQVNGPLFIYTASKEGHRKGELIVRSTRTPDRQEMKIAGPENAGTGWRKSIEMSAAEIGDSMTVLFKDETDQEDRSAPLAFVVISSEADLQAEELTGLPPEPLP